MDLSIANFTYNLPLSNISVASASPFVLMINGNDLYSIRSVFINDVEATRFEVVSVNAVLVEVPLEIGELIHKVSASSSGPTTVAEYAEVSFSLGEMSDKVSGLDAIVQRFLKILLTTRGSNHFDINSGGGLYTLLGANSGDEIGPALLERAVRDAETSLIDDANYASLPSEDQLASVEVLNTSWDEEMQTLALSIKITNRAGETVSTGVSI